MTPEELDAIEALADAVPEGPWVVEADGCGDEWWFGDTGQVLVRSEPSKPTWDQDPLVMAGTDTALADFIAAAREAIPRLVVEVRTLTEERAETLLLLTALLDHHDETCRRGTHPWAVLKARTYVRRALSEEGNP